MHWDLWTICFAIDYNVVIVHVLLSSDDYVSDIDTLQKRRGTVGGAETESETIDQSRFTKQPIAKLNSAHHYKSPCYDYKLCLVPANLQRSTLASQLLRCKRSGFTTHQRCAPMATAVLMERERPLHPFMV